MYVHRPDARIFYQVTGSGTRDLFLLPQCQVVTYSRMWKYQIPYLSRYFRVITMDPRGNGRSDRPSAGYDLDTRYADFTAVLDEVARTPFALVAFSCAAPLAFKYAVEHPERLSHLILLSGQFAESMPQPFEERVARVIRDDFDAWRQRLFRRVFPEPHSLKGMEDCIAWAGETSPHILVDSLRRLDGINLYDLLGRVRVPTLALHGTHDKIVPHTHAQTMVAALPRARLVSFEQGGHGLFARDAVKVNRLIRDFVLDRDVAETTIPATTARAAPSDGARPQPGRAPRASQRRVLWLSSPIGLGHIQRDLAIARRLRERCPDVTVDFLAANPTDRVVEHWGERLHPATRLLQNESAHFDSRENLRLRDELELAYNALRREAAAFRERPTSFDTLVGAETGLRDAVALARKILDGDTTVLLLGETGTGKELFARILHANGPRHDEPFVAQNCGALPESLLESELFGHARGAFTGASGERKGLFEEADRGTIFLDEVGETSPAMQLRLLRVLQEGEIRPVGGAATRRVDVRVIAATNADLEAEVGAGRFRRDLYYRLNVFPIPLPPLRERVDDIPMLAEGFLRQACRRARRVVPSIAPDALRLLRAYPWPGNVRELENELERAVALAENGRALAPAHLSERVVAAGAASAAPRTLNEAVEALKRRMIEDAMRECGSKTRAADRLGLTRQSLQQMLRRRQT